MIAVVDYHKGNLMSVERGIEAAGGAAVITDKADDIARADGIVLPGVGAFADASSTMCALGQLEVVRERIAAGVPFLGICLGMHLLFEEGVEGAPDEDDETSTHNARGLAVLPGVVVRMPKVAADGTAFKVPHVGWNTVVPPAGSAGAAGADTPVLKQSWARTDRPLDDPARAELRAGAPAPADSELNVASSGASMNALEKKRFDCPLFDGIPVGEYFYFTHSYIAPTGPFVVGETAHSVTFPSAVQYGETCFGVQFHPEKSSDAGAAVLRNFVKIVKG